MDKIRSLNLDLLRILSAFYVFIFHVSSMKLGDEYVFSTSSFRESLGLEYLPAHYFVIVFFVLSGFLITMSASRENVTLKSFLIARLGRLYSVLIPALFVSLLVTFILIHGHYYSSKLIQNNTNQVTRFFLNIAFLTQSWTLNATPPLNNPFWSVSYEFMYYLILASFLIIKGNIKYLWILMVVLIAGPKVMLLFPCWFVGSLLYFLVLRKKVLGPKLSFVLFIISSLIFISIVASVVTVPFTKASGDQEFFGTLLFFSWNYQADYFFSILVAINIYSLFGLSKTILRWIDGTIADKLHELVQTVSNCSYTLYLFHLPLLFLFSSLLPYDKTNTFHQIGLISIVLVTIYFIAKQTEWKVKLWRGYVTKIFDFSSKIYLQLQSSILRK
jgi:peptidoglycan/LPS O-acetylase OafA/YrhL